MGICVRASCGRKVKTFVELEGKVFVYTLYE